MSDFSREATNLLRAAEDALTGRHSASARLRTQQYNNRGGERYGSGDKKDPNDTMCLFRAGSDDVGHVLELQRQLRVAMSEINGLRSELMAERESRSQTLTSMGRRWKEEVLVELRAADHQRRCALAELEANVQQHRKEDETARVMMQRQLDDVLRCTKVRERSHFDQQERVQEQLDGLRERLEAAVAECGLVRVESTQQLEKERAALAQRLDVELLRYVDMRREEQREREALKQQFKADMASFGRRVQELVDEAWRTHATTMQRSLRDTTDAFERQMVRHGEIVASMDAKIHDCTTTCRTELRLQMGTTQERIAELEAGCAVTNSRIDRAERKADAAQEATGRTDAGFVVARDVAERAAAQAQRAVEEARRAEAAVRDQDSRVTQLESQLSAVATAEKLRAEIEGVRRMAQRAESAVDALRHVCERGVRQAEHSRCEDENFADRMRACEQLIHGLRAAVESLAGGRVPQLQQRVTALEETRETLAASVARGDDTVVQLQQRLQTLEGTLRVFGERVEQARRDAMGSAHEMATRLDTTSEAALRCETDIAAARGEVERVERRLCHLELQVSRAAADTPEVRGTDEDHAKQASLLLAQFTATAEQLVSQSGAKLLQQVQRVEKTFAERASELEARVGEYAEQLQLQERVETERAADAQMSRALEMVRGEQQRLVQDVHSCRASIDSLSNALEEMNDTVERWHQECVLQGDWNALRKLVMTLDSQLRAITDDAAARPQQQQQQQQQEEEEEQQQRERDSLARLKTVEGEQQRHKHALEQLEESLSKLHAELQALRQRSAAAKAIQAAASSSSSSSSTSSSGGKGDLETEARGVVSAGRGWELQSPLEDRREASSPAGRPLTSGGDVVLRGDHSESSAATTPLSASPVKTNDSGERIPTEATLTSRRQSASSCNNAEEGRPRTVAWGAVRHSTPSSTRVSGQESVAPAAKSSLDDSAAEMGASVMRPPRESSSSTSAERGSLRSQRVGGGSNSISGTPLAPGDGDIGSASATGQAKKAAVADDDDDDGGGGDGAPPPKRTAAWYDDWDDDTTDVENPPANLPPEERFGSAASTHSDSDKIPSHTDKIYTTPRKAFVSEDEDEEDDNTTASVPRHGVVALTHTSADSKDETRRAPHLGEKRFTNFDDTTSEEDV